MKKGLWIFSGILAGILIKLFLVDILVVSGESMMPSIKNGETLLVCKFYYGLSAPFSEKRFCSFKAPQTDDVVIYYFDNKQVVKRIAATGGESLEYSKKSIYNGRDEIFEYKLLAGGREVSLSESQFNRLSEVAFVPEGYLLCLGDNSDVSLDSRHYGFVSEKNILGKVLWK